MDNIVPHIESRNYHIEKYFTGLKNIVGRLVINRISTPYVIKQFSKMKRNDIADLYQIEKNSLHFLQGSPFAPQVHHFDDKMRIIIRDYCKGIDLEQMLQDNRPAAFQSIKKAVQMLALLNKYAEQFPVRFKLRSIDIKRDLEDGVNMLIQTGQIRKSEKLQKATNELIARIDSKDEMVFAHGSLNPGNIIYDFENDKVTYIDFELAAIAPIFYDLGFLLSRLDLHPGEGKDIVRIYSSKLKRSVKAGEIDCYKLISNVLLMGLDSETISSGEDKKGVYSNRMKLTYERLRNPISDSQEVFRFIEEIDKCVYGRIPR